MVAEQSIRNSGSKTRRLDFHNEYEDFKYYIRYTEIQSWEVL